MIDLSIVIPVYNVEEYLEICLNSVLEIKNIKTQIICVNDASTDNSNDILNEYKNKSIIEIYSNVKNSGLAYTRNVGLQHAEGKYVMFVDSDDFIQSDIVANFIKKMDLENLDLLYFDVEEFGEAEVYNVISNNRKRKNSYPIGTGLSIFDLMVKSGEMFGCVWDGIYKREYILKKNLSFIDGILHEDIPFTFKALLAAERVAVVNEVGYYYRQRKSSILHQQNFIERAHGLIVGYSHMIITWNFISEKIDLSKIDNSINQYLNSVVSMIESNLKKVGEDAYCDDCIVNNFMNNFHFNKYRKIEAAVGSEMLLEMRKFKAIALYGAGKIAMDLLPFLKEKGFCVTKIFVTDIRDNKADINGTPIIEYCQEIGDEYDAIVVAVSNCLRQSIVERLLNLGYQGRIITLSL